MINHAVLSNKDFVKKYGNLHDNNKPVFVAHASGDDWKIFGNGVKITRTDDDFAGGTQTDLYAAFEGKINLLPYQKALEKMSDLNIKAGFSESRKRKRVMSDLEGDWDIDKRWEIAPFNSAIKKNMPITSVKINCDFSIPASINSADIMDYAALCWSVISRVESQGISSEVNLVNISKNMDYNSTHNLYMIYNIKKAGTYQDLNSMARFFSCNFYRRAIFQIMDEIPKFYKKTACVGLGTPIQGAFYAIPGEISLAPKIVQSEIDFNDLEKKINIAMGVVQK